MTVNFFSFCFYRYGPMANKDECSISSLGTIPSTYSVLRQSPASAAAVVYSAANIKSRDYRRYVKNVPPTGY